MKSPVLAKSIEAQLVASGIGIRRKLLPALGFLVAPGVSRAFGDSGTAESIILVLAIFLAWLIASGASIFGKKEAFSPAWYFAWAIRLSLPIAILCGFLLIPMLDKFLGSRFQASARKSFESACAAESENATKILSIENSEAPSIIYIDEAGVIGGPEITWELMSCIRNKSSVCKGLKTTVVEWGWRSHYEPCKPDSEPKNWASCIQTYHRVDLGIPNSQAVSIEKPTAEYIIRVHRSRPTFEPGEIRRFHVTLESIGTGKVLASTKLLKGTFSSPCQSYSKEVSFMLMNSFSR